MKNGNSVNSYHIEREVPVAIKLRDFFITLFMWGLWLYIMFPLAAILVWKAAGLNIYDYFGSDMDVSLLYERGVDFLLYGVLIVAATSISIVLWGWYNRLRFAGEKNRRKNPPPRIDCDTMADSLNVESGFIKRFQSARYIQVYHTDRVMKDDVFKPFDKDGVESIALFFCNDWDRVRAESKFGYSHGE